MTQYHWSYTAGQCVYSEHFLRVHLSYWMSSQFTLHHKFRIDSERTKFKQGKTDGILYGCESHKYEGQRSAWAWFDQTTSCIVQAEKSGKDTRIRCVGSIYSLLNEKGSKFYLSRCNAIILYDTLPAYCISKVVVMEPGEIIYEKVYVSPRPPPTISFKDNWMKELDSEVSGSRKDTQRIQPKPKTQLSRTVRPVGGQESTTVEELDIDFRVPDCHMQLWKKQNITEFKSLSKRSRVILIEKHFKPTNSRITSTTHSATIRRRWSANWAM